jgi:secreted trypsin-like serine protease
VEEDLMKRLLVFLLVIFALSYRLPSAHAQLIARPTIVGGSVATKAEFPYQVLVLVNGYMCGGSLIANQYVLTAAHCTVDDFGNPYVASKFTIYAGLQNMGSLARNSLNPYFQKQLVSMVAVHPNYDPDSQDYDVAVLKLTSAVSPSAGIKVVKIATTAPSYYPLYASRTIATVSGWGTTTSDGNVSNVLRKVQVPMVSTAACNAYYGGGITGRMACAGYAIGGKDSCQGDSGGPLVTNQGSTKIQIGIVSWGNQCALARYPGVYTKVSTVFPWIKAQAKLTY